MKVVLSSGDEQHSQKILVELVAHESLTKAFALLKFLVESGRCVRDPGLDFTLSFFAEPELGAAGTANERFMYLRPGKGFFDLLAALGASDIELQAIR